MPVPLVAAIPAIAGAAASIGQAVTGIGAGKRQYRYGKKLAAFQAAMNERYLKMQLDWNDPSNERARLERAGLNPALMYQGGTSGGNQSQPLEYPSQQAPDFRTNAFADMVQIMNQTRLATSQISAQKSVIQKNAADVELKAIQKAVLDKNPVLDPSALEAIVSSIKASAQIKQNESRISDTTAEWMNERKFDGNGNYSPYTNAQRKLDAELDLLVQRFNLGTTDQKIKSEILNGKEFQNAILEVQKKFMTDGEITPQHIYQFLQMLLMKLL